MKKTVKIIVWSLAGLAVVLYGAYAATAPLKLELTRLRSETARISFTEQGVYAYQESCGVYPLIAGEIMELTAKKGDTVKTGDTLAVLEASDLDYEVAKLESAVAGFEAQRAQARELEQQQRDSLTGSREGLAGQIKSLEAQLKTWEKQNASLEIQQDWQYDVVREYHQVVVYASDMVDFAEDTDDDNAITAARLNLAQARQALASARLMMEQLRVSGQPREYYEGQLEALRAELAAIDTRLSKDYSASLLRFYDAQIAGTRASIEQLHARQGKAEARSPVSGVITALDAAHTNLASQQLPIATVEWDPKLEVFLSTRDLDSVHTGDTVSITLESRAGDKSVPGKVLSAETEAVVRLSPLGVEERRVKLLIEPQADGLIIGGDYDVVFTVFERENSITAPKTALFEQDGQDMVWLVKDGRLQKQAVTKSMETREGWLIDAGLAEGDEIVRDANTKGLQEGKKAAAA